MEEMASLWSYQENIDELKQKLLYTTIELEAVKAEADEEMKKSTESMKQLLQLLKVACQERDEARDQLQKLLINIMPSTNTLNDQVFSNTNTPIQNHFLTDQIQQSPLMKPSKANSSITESNSFSEAYNHSSSPVDSLFDPVSSPEFSNINMDTPFVQDYHHSGMTTNGLTTSVPKIDQATLLMESMVKGKTLPEKGKLVQAVSEAGPLLANLLVAGPLPKWRNPPPLQAFHIPPVMGVDQLVGAQKPTMGNSVQLSQSSAMLVNYSSQPYVEMSCGSSSQMMMMGSCANVLNFGDVNFSTNGYGRMLVAGNSSSNFGPVGKRQRIQ